MSGRMKVTAWIGKVKSKISFHHPREHTWITAPKGIRVRDGQLAFEGLVGSVVMVRA